LGGGLLKRCPVDDLYIEHNVKTDTISIASIKPEQHMDSRRGSAYKAGFQFFPLLVESQSTKFLVLHLLLLNQSVAQDFPVLENFVGTNSIVDSAECSSGVNIAVVRW